MKIDSTRPGIVLSFDDWHEKEWVEYLPVLADYKVRATFYPCLRRGVDGPTIDTKRALTDAANTEYFGRLKQLKAAGHVIGYHTINHAIVDVSAKTAGQVIEREITAGVRAFTKAGLKPCHFAFPGGKHNDYVDAILLEHFATLRTIVPEENLGLARDYTPDDLIRDRVFVAYDLKYLHAITAAWRTVHRGRIGFFFAHNPVDYEKELKELLRIAEFEEVPFYTMDDIAGGGNA